MNSKRLASIIIPVYNTKNYLVDCLCSVLNQTYVPTEIILIDDGSTDGSESICDQYANNWANVLVKHIQNSGVSVARNTGLDISRGEYILFVDSDDLVSENYVEELINAIEKEKSLISFAGYSDVFTNKKIEIDPFEKNMLNRDEAIESCLKYNGWQLFVCNKAFKRDIIFNPCPVYFKNNLTIGEDALWLLTVLKKVDNVSCVSNTGYFYRHREGSATSNSHIEWALKGKTDRANASLLCFEQIKELDCSWRVYKRYLFSIKDIVFSCYIQKEEKSTMQFLEKYKVGIKEYIRLVGLRKDLKFIIKQRLLFFLINNHFPRKLVRLVYYL